MQSTLAGVNIKCSNPRDSKWISLISAVTSWVCFAANKRNKHGKQLRMQWWPGEILESMCDHQGSLKYQWHITVISTRRQMRPTQWQCAECAKTAMVAVHCSPIGINTIITIMIVASTLFCQLLANLIFATFCLGLFDAVVFGLSDFQSHCYQYNTGTEWWCHC